MIVNRFSIALVTLISINALAQTNISNTRASDGVDHDLIYWLSIPPSVTGAMYSSPQQVTTSLPLSNGDAVFEATVSGTSTTPSGYLASFNAPAFSLAGFGLAGQYSNVGQVVLYQANSNTGDSEINISSMKITGPDGRSWQFYGIAGDGESTDKTYESFFGQTDGEDWSQVAHLTAGGTTSAPIANLSGTSFSVNGVNTQNGIQANAYIFRTLNPKNISIGVGTQGTKQGMVSGLLPLVPEIVVTCNASNPVKSSEPCTIDVKNPPLESFTINLDPPPGIDSTSSCLTGVVFQQGQTSQTCNMQSSSNITGEITVPAKPIDSDVDGWIITPGTVTLNRPSVQPDKNITSVPVNSFLLLLLSALGIVVLMRRIEKPTIRKD